MSAVRKGSANVSVFVGMENVKKDVSGIDETTNNLKYLFSCETYFTY